MISNKKELLNTLRKNTLSNGFFFIAERGIQLLTFAILVRAISLEEYGILIIGTTLVGQFSFLDGGLSIAIQKYIPVFKVNENNLDVSRAITVTLLFFTSVGFFVCILLLIIASLDLTHFIGIKNTHEANKIVVAAAIFAFFEWPISALENTCKGFNLFHHLNFIRCSQVIVSSAIAIGAALSGLDVIWIFILRWLPRGISAIFVLWLIKSHHHFPLLVFDSRLLQIFRTMSNYSIWVFINRFSSVFVNQFDRIIVSAALGVEKLPIYYGINRSIKIVIQINSILTSAVIPIVSEIFSSQAQKMFNELAYQGTRTLNALFAPLVVLIIIFANPLLEALGGIDLSAYSSCLQIGAFLILFLGPKSFVNSMVLGSGNAIKNFGLFSFFHSIIFLFILFFGIKYYGINGAILAHPLSHFLTVPFWYMNVFMNSGISSDLFIRAVIRGQSTAWIFLISYVSILKITFKENNYFISGMLSLSMIILSWFFSVDPKVRKNLHNLLFNRNSKITII